MNESENNTSESSGDHKPARKKPPFGCCLGLFGLFLGIVFLISIQDFGGVRRAAQESYVKGALIHIGSMQSNFRDSNDMQAYGSFEDFNDNNKFGEGAALANIIENYTLTWDVHNVSTAMTEGISSGIANSFTVIAYPLTAKRAGLHTFAITEEQVVRIYNPENDNNPKSIDTWDPIL